MVGGTGLYLRAALADLDLRPPVPPEMRAEVERELAERGPEALHAELDPDLAATVNPNDRKRIARMTELQRAGIEPPRSSEGLWTAELRHPTLLVGLTMDREELARRIDARVDEMVAAGAADEAACGRRAGASRTARAALGFEELLDGDRRRGQARPTAPTRAASSPGCGGWRASTLIDRTGRDDGSVADEIVAALGENGA